MSLKRKEPEGESKRGGDRRKKPRGEDGEGRYVPPPSKRRAGISFGDEHFAETESYTESGLRKVRPYYFDFETYCKGRWVGKSLLDVFSQEFRAEPLEYYKLAARAGRLRLNREPVQDLSVVLKDNDFLRNTVHRHEPPVTAQPLRILAESEDIVVVDKPSSLPVHPCGRFRHNTVIFILGKEHNMKELHTIHRLDRLTSGVLMFAKTPDVSKKMAELVRERKVEKEYVCRVCGEFPEETVTCEEPIMVVSYKIGVCRVHPEGKPSKTVFQRLSYNGKSSVVKCFPYTGRTHQIRVHLQYLGHPIVNDPVYNTEAWGPNRGKKGEINKTNEELLRTLIEEHKSKQSLDILDVAEDDLLVLKSGQSEDVPPGSLSVPNTLPAETDPACPPKDSSLGDDSNVHEDDEVTETSSADTGGKGQGLLDPLCGECKIIRPDPSPEDLIMYLHALRYKGDHFDYSTDLPEWADDHWVDGLRPNVSDLK
ncbi:RNA pseudouridylate synthase domain-containing protein 2 isoform X1 [Bufo gargarizans]|uniref:RNA pseudouridylate synthase domain-containing protein 2 isoform X1 n=1 Tax=Bufo gargarizans TaxID=30331 RepID=UPI001CF5F82F|nr:RNA pseudouridylate synthase domain-containing protein 2 isoform X1 [Bufo gargarizans]